ncbi:MAG: hypothetical protein JOZ61_03610, partial [Verrucomicrobia bacterium]|nr:hypothetical protein [Verrucomicrobiota bacterium]
LAGRTLGDRSILGLRFAGDPEAGAEKAADGDEAKKTDSHGVKPFSVADLADEHGLANGAVSQIAPFPKSLTETLPLQTARTGCVPSQATRARAL